MPPAPLGPLATPTAAVLVIGNEVLSGRTADANLATIAQKLAGVGIRVRESRVVPDIAAEIIAAVNALRQRFDYLFTTGGIGPTHDDITSAAVAAAFGLTLEEHPEARRRLAAHYPPEKLNPARLRMAQIPPGARLIDNPISAAPGFQLGNVFVLAGVPNIMAAMLDGVLPRLAGGPAVMARTISCELAEGTLAEGLGAVQGRYPEVDIGSYPYFRASGFGVSLVLRATDPDRLSAAAAEVCALVLALGGLPRVTDGQ